MDVLKPQQKQAVLARLEGGVLQHESAVSLLSIARLSANWSRPRLRPRPRQIPPWPRAPASKIPHPGHRPQEAVARSLQ